MSWIAVSLELDARLADAASDALLERGAVSVELADACAGTEAEHAQYGEPIAGAVSAWPLNRITALFDAGAAPERAVSAALRSLGRTCPPLTISCVAEQDWVRLTQRQFQPVQVSGRLWVVPSWHDPPDPHAINLRLDPGRAFGTGAHATTRACLDWLDRNRCAAVSVLDYGCGSGILAIAAKLLGARQVVGTDIDPVALEVSRANAGLNGADALFTSVDTVPSGPYDLVIANILAKPLIALAPVLKGYVRPQGSLVLSGVLEREVGAVLSAYAERGVCLTVASHLDGWVCLAGPSDTEAPGLARL
jgi:ribosomal protein L11 methyltransferase